MVWLAAYESYTMLTINLDAHPLMNRMHRPDEILRSFQPYYRSAQLETVTDPNIVHELMTKLVKSKRPATPP